MYVNKINIMLTEIILVACMYIDVTSHQIEHFSV